MAAQITLHNEFVVVADVELAEKFVLHFLREDLLDAFVEVNHNAIFLLLGQVFELHCIGSRLVKLA